MVEIEEQSIKCFFHTLQKDWSRDFRLLVDQEEGEWSMIRAEYGATFHVTPNLEWYSNYTVKTSRTIRLGNGQECKIAGTGEVPIQLPNGNTITLHQVRHVVALKRSLVSIGILAEDGYKTTLNESTWMISRGNLRIGSGHKYNNLYPLMAINPIEVVNVAEKTDPNLWHGRLDHMLQAELDRLMTVSYIPKLQAKMDSCEHWQYGKQT